MRAAVLLAAVLGAAAGGVAGWCAGALRDPATPPVAPSDRSGGRGGDASGVATVHGPECERLSRTIDALSQSVERLSARIEALGAPAEDRPARHASPDDVRPGRADPPAAPERRVSRAAEWDQLTDDDLEMEADERHVACTDSSGAVQRYRALLARGGTPGRRVRWWLRLGDCLQRLARPQEVVLAYRAAVEESSEDTAERCEAATSLVQILDDEDFAAALPWAEIAAQSRFAERAHWERLANTAEEAGRIDRARAALERLVRDARARDDAGDAGRYQARLDELAGR